MSDRIRSRGPILALLLVGLAVVLALVLRRDEASIPGPVASSRDEATHVEYSGGAGRGTAPARVNARGSWGVGPGLIESQIVLAGSRGPLVGAELCALRTADLERLCGRTDAEGRITFELPLGAYRLFLADEEVTLVGCAQGDGFARVELTADRPRAQRTLLAIGASQVIEGIVFDRYGGVVEGALVEPRGASSLDEAQGLDVCALATTGEDGRFRLAVPAGPYSLKAASAGYGVGFAEDARPGSLAEITLAPEARVRGQVLRHDNDRPVAGAEVRALREVGAGWQLLEEVETDAEGRFAFGGLPAGRLRVEASAEGLFGPGEVVTSESEEELRVDVRVGPGFDLRAELLIGDERRPCPLGSLELEHESLGLRFQASVSERGVVSLEGLPKGVFRARAQCLALAAVSGPEQILVEGSTRATWVFGGGGSLRGQVRRAGGDDAPGVLVVLLGQESALQRPVTVLSDTRGEFLIEGLAPGAYEAIVAPDDFDAGATVQIEEGREASVELRVAARGSVEGRAVDRFGNPCEGLEVRGERASGAFSSARVDAGGRFVLAGLEPGAYAIGLVGEESEVASVDLRDERRVEIELGCVDRRAQIRGRALDASGEALVDALVEATPLDPEGQPRFERTGRSVLSGPDGGFTIPGLEEGRYLVTLRDRSGVEVGSIVADTSESAQVQAEATGTLTGSLQASDGELVLPVAIEVQRDDGAITRRVLVDDPASPWQVDGLRPGRYSITARAAGGWRGSSVIDVVASEPAQVDVVLASPTP